MKFLSIKDIGISADKHALIIPPFMSRGKRVHPMPFPDSSVPGKLFLFCFGLLVYNGLCHVPYYNLFYVQHSFLYPFLCVFTIKAGGNAVQPRPMDPKKDLAVYGYGSVAWKERIEEWKKRQNEKIEVVKHEGGNDGGKNGDELDDPDLPK